MKVTAVHTPLFGEGVDLVEFCIRHLPPLRERAVVVVTSKIAALAEKRTVLVGSPIEQAHLIQAESESALPTKYVWLTLKDGMIMMSAGIDDSNADGRLVLLPENSYAVAEQLWSALRIHYRLRELGVLISDSRTAPLRAGVTGVALGYAGIKGLRDYRGLPDLHGRPFRFAQTDVADSIATAATLVMGEGAERQPLAVIESAPVEFQNVVDREELWIAPEDDVYRPLLTPLLQSGGSTEP